MSVMRFTGTTSREAMRQVRAALGDEALILANRHTEQGVEILAMAETGGAEPAVARPRPVEAPPLVPTPTPVAPEATRGREEETFQAMSARLLAEMQEMRSLLTVQRAEASPSPRQRLMQWLLEAGFSRAVGEEVLEGLPECLAPDDEATWLVNRLAARLLVEEDELALLDRGGIVALVGPTGVGKTTTAAKLAARFVMRHGPDAVALVSTDGFRIGAHEQLRIYAELLGVPMHGLDLDQPLETLHLALADRRFVIVDTVGMSQRDRRVIDQLARLKGDTPVRPLLVLNAVSQPEALEEVIINYRQAARAAGMALDDCLISKHDEAGRLGPLLDALMRHGLRLRLVAQGQRVPEDLVVMDAATLVSQALDVRSTSIRPEPPAAAALLLGQGRRVATLLSTLRERVPGFADLARVWQLAGVPPALQSERLASLLGQARLPGGSRVWMPRTRVRNEAWSQPDLALDAAGQWSALPVPQHLAPAGELERLVAAEEAGPLGAHLLAGLPGLEARTWLAEQQRDWIAQVRGTQRVVVDGERQPLAALAAVMSPRQPRALRWRGREAQLALKSCTVGLGRGETEPLRAWAGELVDAYSGRVLKRGYWLSPATLRGRAVPLLVTQLLAEALPALTRRATRRLVEADPAMAPALRLTLAAGLASVATRLEASDEAWVLSLRGELLALLAGRKRGSAETLLEALLQLCLAREALRELGTVGLEGLH
ncbi:flagellar biosynthesis protein FlhF [Halomonas sp. A11-A]|uniref:flagellar biosynthesis protein FlhF n=1 Tax=Halomonas sp. A11-A TaxID=2183985 RepID=UPI000D70E3B6|nr:flagellar biosynthesis protein FlhF [Halomonas sp. A11-A]PWV70253.1 flagellar biosynthesis protein FlhF [Halomonas sp. A11-A]